MSDTPIFDALWDERPEVTFEGPGSAAQEVDEPAAAALANPVIERPERAGGAEEARFGVGGFAEEGPEELELDSVH